MSGSGNLTFRRRPRPGVARYPPVWPDGARQRDLGCVATAALPVLRLRHIDGIVLPPSSCGGLAALDVQLVGHPAGQPSVTIATDGLLRIDCLIGDPPPSGEEGVRLNIKEVTNFNKTVRESDTTLFIAR